MQANKDHVGRDGKLRLNTTEFDRLARTHLGLPQTAADHEVAARLELDPATLSQLRNHHRQPGTPFFRAVRLHMPYVLIHQITEVVP